MIRILIADDHAMVRGGLKQIIATGGDLCVVGEAVDGASTLAALERTPCDMLLLDMTMPGLSGIELIRHLRQAHPALPILVLSMHNEGQIVSRALKAGAAGYVTKGSEPEVLLAAIRKIAGGGKFIDPSLVEAMVFEKGDDDQLPHELLSERELQILKLIAGGSPLGRIADRLHLSPKTVSTYKMRLMEKLAIDNNAELIRYATRHGLIAE
ncbi:MAG TPA: response regulator transcription factor [Azospira sp.]|nr:response regulator transcription factor [Azospira sp.]